MPNIESKNKSVRSSQAKADANKSFKSQVKTAIKRAKLGLQIKDSKINELINHACAMVDKAVSQNIFHVNKAARIKSKLMKRNERNQAILNKDHKIEDKIRTSQAKSETPSTATKTTSTAAKKTTTAKPKPKTDSK